MNLSEYIKNIKDKLLFIYDENEANSIVNTYCKEILRLSNTDFILSKNELLSNQNLKLLNNSIERLLNGEPLQYVLGYSYFYDTKFIVDKSVLIPRPETELLVDFIIKKHKERKNLKILDLCSGSGCIAITLRKNLPNSSVFAIDVSDETIEIFKKNCILNSVDDIKIEKYDVLSDNKFPFSEHFDIIISNPPYVLESEKIFMHKNVLCFEPEIALFVSDNNPLIFYEKIAKLSKNLSRRELKNNTELYFEINEKFADEIILINKKNGFQNNEIIKDFNGKNRFVFGIIKNLM